MNKIASIAVTTTVIVFAMSGSVAAADRPGARERCHLSQQEVTDWGETSTHLEHACDEDAYTVLDHPSRACHLSEADVANWGETSAHLPQACSYGKK
jgi:hypothetical protein